VQLGEYRLHSQQRRRPWTLGQDDPRRHRRVTSATTTVASVWSARPQSGRSPSQLTVLTVLTRMGSPPIPDLLETPSRPVRNLTAPTSERLAEVLEALGLPTLARRLSEEAARTLNNKPLSVLADNCVATWQFEIARNSYRFED
jgi:hypothetical protein